MSTDRSVVVILAEIPDLYLLLVLLLNPPLPCLRLKKPLRFRLNNLLLTFPPRLNVALPARRLDVLRAAYLAMTALQRLADLLLYRCWGELYL